MKTQGYDLIGDIHGQHGKLVGLLEAMGYQQRGSGLRASWQHPEGRKVIFLGDYIDRGPDSCAVVDRLVAFSKQWPCTFLLGNHESMFLDFLGWTDDRYFGGDAFLMNGGDRTLASYGYFDRERPDRESFELPKAHEDFLLALVSHHRDGDYVFVHAGLGADQLRLDDATYALRKTRPEDLLWN
ncbi:MAG: serine/threonine protein phosphatase, partial [Verrucomicrobiales bacterium]|nr:serine/threonine protein phosphatase [Verrucomicrobiales bacterium]